MFWPCHFDGTEIDVVEPHTAQQPIKRLQGHVMLGYGLGDENRLGADANVSRLRDSADQPRGGIDGWLGPGLRRAASVEFGGRFAMQRLMRSNVIELLTPAVATALLGAPCSLWCQLQLCGHVSVHSLVRPVVLRLAHAGTYDANS